MHASADKERWSLELGSSSLAVHLRHAEEHVLDCLLCPAYRLRSKCARAGSVDTEQLLPADRGNGHHGLPCDERQPAPARRATHLCCKSLGVIRQRLLVCVVLCRKPAQLLRCTGMSDRLTVQSCSKRMSPERALLQPATCIWHSATQAACLDRTGSHAACPIEEACSDPLLRHARVHNGNITGSCGQVQALGLTVWGTGLHPWGNACTGDADLPGHAAQVLLLQQVKGGVENCSSRSHAQDGWHAAPAHRSGSTHKQHTQRCPSPRHEAVVSQLLF